MKDQVSCPRYIQQLQAENASLRRRVQQQEDQEQQQLDRQLQHQLHPAASLQQQQQQQQQTSHDWANLSIQMNTDLLSIIPDESIALAPSPPQAGPSILASNIAVAPHTQPAQTYTSWEPTLAERVVIQMLFPTWEGREKNTTFRATIEQYLGSPESAEASSESEDRTPPPSPMTSSSWPVYVLAEKLVHLFFELLFPAYPVLDKAEILNE